MTDGFSVDLGIGECRGWDQQDIDGADAGEGQGFLRHYRTPGSAPEELRTIPSNMPLACWSNLM
jgi:hypothetical protein